MQIAELEYLLEDAIPTQRTLHLRIGEPDVRLACEREAQLLQPKAVVPGFRKGRAPLKRILVHHWPEISTRAFSALRQAAEEQVFAKLEPQDKPFTPPEVLEPGKIVLKLDQPLEFSLKYLVDPTLIGAHPEQPEQQGAVLRGNEMQPPRAQPLGIPLGPRLPSIPGVPGSTEGTER
jgi:FKBP-type peptidyl-prolyl cis-trans isomerase (trigger factor)